MSIRAQQIAELEEQLALHQQTQEAYEAWRRDSSTPIEFLYTTGEWRRTNAPCWSNEHYRIAPKPKLRPWKPEEAIGKLVRRKGGGSNLHLIYTAHPSEIGVAGMYCSYTELLSDFEQLDGSPCGVMEP